MAHFCFSLLGKFVLSHQDFFLSSFFAFFLFSLVLHNLFQLFLVIPFSIHVHCFPVVRSIKRNFCPINEQGKYFRANIYIKREHGKGWLDLFKETANTNELRGVITFLFLYALYNTTALGFTLLYPPSLQHRVCTYKYAERLLLLRLKGWEIFSRLLNYTKRNKKCCRFVINFNFLVARKEPIVYTSV